MAWISWARSLGALYVVLSLTAPAFAQEQAGDDTDVEMVDVGEVEPERDTDAARDAFMAGQAAAEEGRWSDSLNEFQRSYLLSGAPTALYNAAMALRALGRHREARDAFQRIMDSHGDHPAAAASAEKREEEAARVAVLLLAGLDPSVEYEIRLDGRVVDAPVEEETRVEADPGRRGLTAEREGYEPYTWEGDLSDGETRTLEVEMVEVPSESRSVFRSPIFWAITGAVLVGAGVGVGIYLRNNAQLDPNFPDNSLNI
ncbi:MAG: tetratricopeptide repeat protein [Myxococcota bacterium]